MAWLAAWPFLPFVPDGLSAIISGDSAIFCCIYLTGGVLSACAGAAPSSASFGMPIDMPCIYRHYTFIAYGGTPAIGRASSRIALLPSAYLPTGGLWLTPARWPSPLLSRARATCSSAARTFTPPPPPPPRAAAAPPAAHYARACVTACCARLSNARTCSMPFTTCTFTRVPPPTIFCYYHR